MEYMKGLLLVDGDWSSNTENTYRLRFTDGSYIAIRRLEKDSGGPNYNTYVVSFEVCIPGSSNKIARYRVNFSNDFRLSDLASANDLARNRLYEVSKRILFDMYIAIGGSLRNIR